MTRRREENVCFVGVLVVRPCVCVFNNMYMCSSLNVGGYLKTRIDWLEGFSLTYLLLLLLYAVMGGRGGGECLRKICQSYADKRQRKYTR